ncbi:Uncharacterised protein [[Clostridium] sordellii]|uniref:hypothetical protein n=1 Tax=Paraclostridium sordellii TaxID=1505 RepID=UPI0005DADE3D|nr:hypothetical protein [Paeniclostridium sordellii]MBS6024098.1 hypothetical protein [Paeniclostridium sordellii]MCR1850501.1 hypothetical protein [Paeniclostridium sordellii]MDU1455266.1 hypothetical protein [Paeniclostridium sordellii]MDU2688276.1 hypothetical protein [Paeniclostridium sordellii]MRZ81493.1 hypothetical protein [Paeniclostridium sordellii]
MIFNKTTIRNHHGHDHEHDQEHCHSHCSGGAVAENKDEKTLNILLVHWVNHNESHEEGFREWVDKARDMGKEETANNIEEAIKYLRKANEMLLEAKKNM